MKVRVNFEVTTQGLFCAVTHCRKKYGSISKARVFEAYRRLCHYYGFPFVGFGNCDTWWPEMDYADEALDWMKQNYDFDPEEIEAIKTSWKEYNEHIN